MPVFQKCVIWEDHWGRESLPDVSVWEGLYSTTFWRYFPSFAQIDQYVMAKPSGENQLDIVWVKDLTKCRPICFCWCKGLAWGEVDTTKEKLGERSMAAQEKCSLGKKLTESPFRIRNRNNIFESLSLFLSFCWKAVFHYLCQKYFF